MHVWIKRAIIGFPWESYRDAYEESFTNTEILKSLDQISRYH
jgi:hypothetical protein